MSAKINQLVQDLVSQGRFDEAHSVLSRWASQQGDDPEAQMACGNLSYIIGRFPEAERYLRQALQSRQDADGFYTLGLTLTKLNRPAEAMAAFREACDRKQGFAVGHLNWGLSLLQMNSHRGALGQFRQALTINPKLVAAAYQAGIAAYQLGQYADAVEFFADACEKDPTLSEAFNGMGTTLCALGQHEKALDCFAKALQINPNLASVKRSWAAALTALGRLDEATKQYSEALNLPPKLLEARERALIYNDWGVNLVRQGRIDEAAERLLSAVNIDPLLLEARLNLGIVRNQMREYEQAADAFEKALELGPDLPLTNFHLGISYFLLGQFQKALDHLAVARTAEPDSPTLNLWIGYAFMALNDQVKAEAQFRLVVQKAPGSYLGFDALGCCLSAQKRFPEAIEMFQRCLSLNNRFGLCHIHLGKTLEQSGKQNEAAAQYKAAVEQDPQCILPEKEIVDELINHASFDLAIGKSQKLLSIVPDDTDMKLALARSLKARDRIGEAVTVLEQLLHTHAQNGLVHVLLGQIFLSQGRLLEADERFRSAAALCEGDVTLFYSWGKALALLGMHALALEKFEKANEIDPYDSDTYEAWGATLKALGRYQEAGEVFKRAAQYL